MSTLAPCRPRWATPRRDRPTYAPRFEAHHVAMTGERFMPWQRDVMDVAMEYDPATGLLAFRTVVIKVPRQSGKTTLGDAVIVGRAMSWPDQGCLLMAQDRNMSRRRLLDELVDRRLAVADAYTGRFHERRLTGSEQITFDTGSWVTIAAVTADAGHGLTLDVCFLDEAWSHPDFRSVQALSPTMITRPDPQLWIVSTEGTEDSALLDFYTALGRDSVDDESSTVCYFEWSKPDDADPYDESRWAEWMPALGHTATVDAVRALAATMPESDFLRSLCNVKTSTAEAVFPVGAWDACAGDHAPAGQLHLSIDIKPDRSRACLAVCGEGVVEVIDDHDGTDWIVPRVVELDRRHSFACIAVDAAGPGVTVISTLEYQGLRVRHVDVNDLKSACGRFYDAVLTGQLRHRGQGVLDDAVRAARRRVLLDAWAWTRKGSGYISPLVAATIAYWSYTEAPDPPLWIM